MTDLEWRLKALTDIWTGDVHGRPNRLIPTGIMGSLRWWFEVLVRGLGGAACDPTLDGIRCPDRNGKHCVVCELFGCTGWARKFRLTILDENGEVIQEQIRANTTVIFRFVPLRPIREEEWCLLDATLRLIADYGALGGKTVFKPSDEPGRENAFHHKDFGLIKVLERPESLLECRRKHIENYTQNNKWRQNIPYTYSERNRTFDYSWASLQNFWYVKGRYLSRMSYSYSIYNRVLGRDMRKNRSQNLWQGSAINRWLAGRPQESKKVFSFKNPEEARRTFGFVRPGLVDFEEMKQRLRRVWSDFNPTEEFLTGEHILGQLFQQEESE